jgi:hypothetical protein
MWRPRKKFHFSLYRVWLLTSDWAPRFLVIDEFDGTKFVDFRFRFSHISDWLRDPILSVSFLPFLDSILEILPLPLRCPFEYCD